VDIIPLKNVKQLPSDVRLRGYVNTTPSQIEALFLRRFGERPTEVYQVPVGRVEYLYAVIPQEAK
jgi:hypothetical protein